MPFASGLFGRSDAVMTSGANATKNVNSMAKVIEYYVPQGFRRPARWIPVEERGKIIAFSTQPQRKSA
jgi:hypothetical protein